MADDNKPCPLTTIEQVNLMTEMTDALIDEWRTNGIPWDTIIAHFEAARLRAASKKHVHKDERRKRR